MPGNVNTESESGLQERTVMPQLINPAPLQPVNMALSAMEAQAHVNSGVIGESMLPSMTSALYEPVHTTTSGMEVDAGIDFESDGAPLSLNSSLYQPWIHSPTGSRADSKAGPEATLPSMVSDSHASGSISSPPELTNQDHQTNRK